MYFDYFFFVFLKKISMENLKSQAEELNSIDKEKATKIILELYSIKENLKNLDVTKDQPKEINKKIKNFEKSISVVEKDLENLFNIELSLNKKRMFLKLKEGDFGKDLLEVVKYLE